MAKRNNKGFSLIEIVIAMAVLTLLLTPIIKQFAQTMKVSRQAKEQQYINEEASYSLEEAQVTPTKEYEQKYLDYVAANPEYTFATGTDTVQCQLVDASGTEINLVDGNGNALKDAAGNTVNYIEYTVESYTLKNVRLGYKNSLFNKVVSIDNLATQVRGCKNSANDMGLSIKYNMTEAELPTEEYTLTNEGSAVKRDANGNVISVVVEESTYVGNPNDTNLGNMHDLDYEKVALINGTATNFDDMAETALFSLAMDKLKEVDYASWEQGILHQNGDGILQQKGYSPVIKKLTKLYVDKLSDGAGEYYLVKCDVYYHCTYSISSADNQTEDLNYNVFSQKFYTDKCPDIYFQYQPFVNELIDHGNGTYTVNYAENDYILIDNYVDDVKLYLYKPYKDAINIAANGSASACDAIYELKDFYTYTTRKPTETEKSTEATYKQFCIDNAVNIHIAKANSSIKDVKIYTNLDTNVYIDKSQFHVTAYPADSNASEKLFKDFEYTSNSTTGESSGVRSDKNTSGADTFMDYDRGLILPIDADTRYDDRLRTVTVTMLPIKTDSSGNAVLDGSGAEVIDEYANKVVLSGAKGEK